MALSVHEDRRDSHTVMARLMERIEMDCAEDGKEEEEEGRVFVAISSSALLSVVVIAMMVSLGVATRLIKAFREWVSR